jgi:D-alanine transaminase
MRYILQNDQIIPRTEAVADIDDRGLQFGDGIYEAVRLYEGRPFLMDEHLTRLRRSARELGMSPAFAGKGFEARLEELAQKEGISTGILYFQVTRGVYPRSQEFPPADLPVQILAYARPLARPLEQIQGGTKVAMVPDIRWLRCDIKSLNLLPNVLARQAAKERGCGEAVQHRDGIVTEGAFSNVFKVSSGTVFTHPESNLILSGITRAHVMGLARAAGIPVREEAFTTSDLCGAEEVFITSTSNEVMPVIAVDGRAVGDGKPGEVTRRLQLLYEESALGGRTSVSRSGG